EFQRQGSTAGHGGWSYWLICYDVEGNEILSFTTVGDKRIAMDDYFYKCINGTLDKKYFAEILNEVSETEISTENIVAESGDEKLKTYLETQMGEALSEEEIQWFETEFFNTEENRMPNMFLTSDYDRPENINLNHLFYCGADGFGGGEISEEEKDLLYQRYTVPQLDFTRTTTDEMNVLLQKYMNISLEEANQLWLEYMYYLPEYNAYYKVVGDTKYSKYDIMAGWKNPDGTISLVYTDKLTSIVCYFEVTLQKDGNSYYFLSNIQLPEDLSVITTAKISEEEALRRTSDVDGQIYTTMINDQVGYTLRCSSPAASLMEKVLCKTSDGGNTYEEYLDISSMGNYPQGVYFFTEEIGYIITDYHGNFNFLYRTEDGGKTWTPQMIYIPGSWYSYINGLSIENGVLQIEVFVDEDAFYYAYTTDDMGETWKLSYGER
ncbi:MAG: hypothetical protein IJ958_05180, partial [Agathobacter sp.]|nr:hypothetical protein [Agathobacter sp.]